MSKASILTLEDKNYVIRKVIEVIFTYRFQLVKFLQIRSFE